MKTSRLALLCLMVALVVSGWMTVRADDAGSKGWLTDYKQALANGKANKKIVFADFTGSDWCGFCIKLKKEVLDTDDLKKMAADKFVLLELDYPRAKEQSDEQKQQNADLAKQFKVHGFPTIILLDGDGKELGRIVGYGGKDKWAAQLNDILAKLKG